MPEKKYIAFVVDDAQKIATDEKALEASRNAVVPFEPNVALYSAKYTDIVNLINYNIGQVTAIFQVRMTS